MKTGYLGLILLLFSGMNPVIAAQTEQKFYNMNCASCHGKKGEKTALNKARPLISLTESQIIEALTERRNGDVKGAGNQVKKRLTDEDIKNLAKFIPTMK
ncbi:c-type cytochrome [Budviciaceae bacterium BWR-B9]|uniref:C-type cytochrome n=1 Tax=Limnobaculum allomyrinae TaxID=2791986 RepID=A0ABS1IKJ2_9GAMM|nr:MULTISPECIES: c-type cytochrome [Limnobaculum]MBK5142248.1 c-type cytochrome [Limnobaculum allomyrinae]MBV7690868.1 c-type cytochrome [Limnobaculum sp. M2-1]